MLRFFRNIRQKLLQNGNLRKYFWYALGEVFLVVIGILIALQINNWNENRLQNNERITLLHAIEADFRTSRAELQELASENDDRSEYLKQLLSYSAGEPVTISRDSLYILLQESLRFTFYANFSTSYEQAKASGKLSLFQNEALLKALAHHEENFEGYQSVDLPVFNEGYADVHARVQTLNILDRLLPPDYRKFGVTQHPSFAFNDRELTQYIQSEEMYERLYFLHFLNAIASSWIANLEASTSAVLSEIEVSLEN